MSEGPLILILEVTTAFLEASFSMKLDNNARKLKAKVNGTNDLCAKLDPVASVNVLATARMVDRGFCRIQNFWLDIATAAEELELPVVSKLLYN